ncbi:MAG: GNAT family N-acetyltransferase [Anaerolineales bacterium]|nr:GNAT family N-acetyltransferase [Anaerolineales bacterium]
MTIKMIQNPDDFQNLRREWNALLSISASRVPFLRHEYLTSWWETRGGGEWKRANLFILIDRNTKGKLTGIAPLFLHQDTLMFLGSHEISDYLDVIAHPDDLQSFLQKTFTFLAEESPQIWKKLDFYNLLEGSSTLPLIKEISRSRGWEHTRDQIQPAPSLTLPANWDAYLDQLETRYRHEIERKIRRAEGYFLPVDWYMVEYRKDLEEELAEFLKLMAHNDEKADFLTESMTSQLKSSVYQAFDNGWLQLAFLTVGDLKAAAYLNFDFNNRIWIYNSGLNPMFENISPGWVLLAHIIQNAIRSGKEAVDFMRGNEGYKYQFGGIDRHVFRVQITRKDT